MSNITTLPAAMPMGLKSQVTRLVQLTTADYQPVLEYDPHANDWLERRRRETKPGHRKQCEQWWLLVAHGYNGVTETSLTQRETAIWLMCRSLPGSVWCEVTMRAVWAKTTFLPTPGECHEVLTAHAAPLFAEIAALERIVAVRPPTEPANTAGSLLALQWLRYRKGTEALPAGVTLDSWLKNCRANDDPTYRYLLRSDPAAAAIAQRNGWEKTDKGERTPDELEAVANAVREAVGAMRSLTAIKAATEPLVPRADVAAAAIAFEHKHGRKPGEVTPEHLTILRKAHGINVPVVPNSHPLRRPANDVWTAETDPAGPKGAAGPFPWS